MTIITETSNFLSHSQVSLIPENSMIVDVFKVLQKHNAGGFIVQTEGIPGKYVKANKLGEAIVSLSKREGDRWLRGRLLADVLETPEVQDAIVKIPPGGILSTTDSSTVDQTTPLVFQVRDMNSAIGWFLSQLVVSSFQTPPPKFICQNGHDNPDPDHGTCYVCPGKIVRTG